MKIGEYKTVVHFTKYVEKKYVKNGKASKYYPDKCYIKLHAVCIEDKSDSDVVSSSTPWFVFDEWMSINEIKNDDSIRDMIFEQLYKDTKMIIDKIRLINEQALYLISIRYNAKFLEFVTYELLPSNREEVTNKLCDLIS